MIFVDYFSDACCKGTELTEGWYWYDDADDQAVGGPYEDEEAAIEAAAKGAGWK